MSSYQPFKDLLARAFADAEDTQPRGLWSLERPPDSLEVTPTHGRPRQAQPSLSAEVPASPAYQSAAQAFNLRSLDDLDDAPDDLSSGEAWLTDSDALNPLVDTRPYDLRQFARVCRELKKERASSQPPENSLAPRSTDDFDSPATHAGKPHAPAEKIPVTFGESTCTWRMQHGNLRPILIEPLEMTPATDDDRVAVDAAHQKRSISAPSTSRRTAEESAPRRSSSTIAKASNPRRPMRRLVTMIQPNHRQRNTAENFYLLALEALSHRDKKTAITHLRTAAALNPTVERYQMMITDLLGSTPSRQSMARSSPSVSDSALPVVKGRAL